jgi:copper(I)-binding protein
MSANASVRFGPGYGPVIVLTGLKSSLGGGQSVQVTFTFASAGSITVSVPVALTSDGPQDAPSIPVTQTSPSE